jgi:hypothetical protein
MRRGYQKSFQQQSTCVVTQSVSIVEFSYKHWPKWLSTQSSVDRFCMDLCGDCSMQVATKTQVTVQLIGWLLWGESFIFLYTNTLFPTLRELVCTDMASQITAEIVWSPQSSSDPICLHTSKHLVSNSPQWTNCSKLSFPSLHNTLLIMKKCDCGYWLITVLSHVKCHTGLSSHVNLCQVINYTHNEIN